MKRKWWMLSLIVLLSAAAVNAQLSKDFSDEFLDSATGRALIQTYGALKSNYLNDVDDELVMQGAINGMLEALEDPYTRYSTPEEAAREMEQRGGSFQGIGATIAPLDRNSGTGVEVINVYRGSPAWNAGIQKGDIFYRVDGVDVENATPSEVSDLTLGPKGTTVEIDMLRPGLAEPIHFSIVRDRVELIAVESTVLPNNVGYVSINTFGNENVYEQLQAALDGLREQGISSLVLDLRDNPGGLLSEGIQVADEFLTKGDIVFQRARGVTQRLASADSNAFDLPMVVLVNSNSASASEIVAGALQENGRALVIGEDTFGKGVGQSVIPLTDGGQLIYLSFEWLTPERNSINEEGITPDVFAKDTRFPTVITLQGQGATPGQEIEFVVDGEVLGKATVDEDGEFSFFEPVDFSARSEVSREAIVDLENDASLQVAVDALLEAVKASAE